MQKINFQNLPNTTTPINATNLNAIQTNAETAINNVDTELSKAVDLFQDTIGTDWKNFLKNKIDFAIANMDNTKTNTSAFINGGWAGHNYGFGICGKININYLLVWYSSYGTYYCLFDGTNYNYAILNGNNYSSNEQIIGTWTDGKPIYRTVIQSSSVSIDISSLNIDSLVKLDVKAYINNGIVFNTGRYQNSSDFYTYYMNMINKVINIDLGSAWTLSKAEAILEYTKSTD